MVVQLYRNYRETGRRLDFLGSMAALAVSDFIYALRMLNVMKGPVDSILHLIPEVGYEVFMFLFLLTVVRGLPLRESRKRDWIFISVPVFIIHQAVSIKYILIPYCHQNFPMSLKVLSVGYAVADSVLFALVLPFATRIMERKSYWFTQCIFLFLISDFSLRYNAGINYAQAYSWDELGWCAAVLGLGWLVYFDRTASFTDLRSKLAPPVSVRNILAVAVGGTNLILLVGTFFIKIISFQNAVDITSTLALVYVMWLLANEFSLWLANDISRIIPQMYSGNEEALLEEVKTENSIYEFNRILKSYNGLVHQGNRLIALSARMNSERAMVEAAAQVSHDIRSPLSALNMISRLANLPQDQSNLMKNAIARINELSEDLLTSAKQKTDLAPVRLAQELESLLVEKRLEYWERKNLEITSNFANAGEIIALADAKELKRVVSNLINNAAAATPSSGGRIAVSIELPDQFIVIRVRDQGGGIPAELQERLGKPGVTSRPDGHGLGLYHAFRTAEIFGGRLDIKSTLGRGTEVDLLLQRAPNSR